MPKLKLPERKTEFIQEIRANFAIKAMGKPRMTISDKWNKRPNVIAWRKQSVIIRESCGLKPMEKFRSARLVYITVTFEDSGHKANVIRDHNHRPDVDNICKSVLDSLIEKDEYVQTLEITKSYGSFDEVTIILRDVERYL
jgi:Holliday junction resolvase RusA-like endonuclease